ncbi:DMT family transporter [Henriciella sp.]|jgi:drug/metabolite transporter (DMT)-like permease|uniref:DMT family transporter n=1 Tax=Henriciella sp. TaxID=1968823 RepID=UPI0025C532D1|nr:DMT family transporter [Henriciella sp.]|tara:strand:+ start:3349 stop:4329 length:981 start_codon:yes stop_codon:yes gene_type:complete
MSREMDETAEEEPNAGGLSGNALGAVFMLFSALGFTAYTVLSKTLTEEVHPVFLAFWRAFFACLLSVPVILRAGLHKMRTRHPGLLLMRSLFGTLGFTLAIVALSADFNLTFSQFNAISFSRSLFVTVLAAIFLREVVGLHRWGAVVIGFFGVLIMVVPGVFMFWAPVAPGAGFHLDTGTICAILSAFFLAFAIVLVKTLSAELSAVALLTYANVLSSILLLPFAIYFWSWPSMETWGWIFVMAGVGFVAQFCYISAVSIGDASFLSPLDYLRLPMATAADLIIVGMLPGMNVWIGAGIIIVSAVYITWRDRKKKAQKVTVLQKRA